MRWFFDPGHAWLRVKRVQLKELGILDKVSGYSYERGKWVYLEEDCDAQLLFDAMGFCLADARRIPGTYSKTLSKIRSYQNYKRA